MCPGGRFERDCLMLDLLIKNARIIDGTGAPAYVGAVGVKGGKLVMANGSEDATQVIEAAGRCLVPGFIDSHSHTDLLIGSNDSHIFKTNQGITTEVVGQCGLSVAPIDPKSLTEVQERLTSGTTFFHDDMVNWTTFARYLEYADTLPKTTNIKSYVGHSTLRIAAMGIENRPATARELDKMKGMLREAMQAGAAGLSTGLIYTPSCYATEEEIVELAKVAAEYNGIYASHMRDESNHVVEAVKETINVGRLSGAGVCISHHKMLGKENWGRQKETLRLINEANDEGISVICDQYPYTRNMTSLNACMPPWYFSEGHAAVTERLKDKAFRAKMRADIEDPNTPYDNYFLNAGGFDGIYVYSAENTPLAEGLFIGDYARRYGIDPWDALFDICADSNYSAGAVFSSMCDEDVCEIIQSPYCIVGTDGFTRTLTEKGHPRTTATFPRAINYFVKEKKILTIEEMIRKMTGLSANYLRIKNKGIIKDGYDADLVLFDYNSLQDTATYDNSNSLTEGIDYVIVGGEIVYHDKKLTGNYPGKMLRHNG